MTERNEGMSVQGWIDKWGERTAMPTNETPLVEGTPIQYATERSEEYAARLALYVTHLHGALEQQAQTIEGLRDENERQKEALTLRGLMTYIGLMMTVCSVCGKVPWPFEPPREEEQPDGSVLVYGSLSVCACDPRYTGPTYEWANKHQEGEGK